MKVGGRFGKYGESKRNEKLRRQKSTVVSGQDLFRRQEHIKISPKHPGRGRG